MTYLIAGAVLLIVGSAISLVAGWIGANETFIWVSIFASVGAALCLALAYHRSRHPGTGTNRPPKA